MIPRALSTASLKPIMLSILKEGETYGYRIIRRVEHLSDGHIEWTAGTLYPVLHRFETKGYVESFWRMEDGRNRKYYRLTARGEKALAMERQHWVQVNGVLEKLWGPDFATT